MSVRRSAARAAVLLTLLAAAGPATSASAAPTEPVKFLQETSLGEAVVGFVDDALPALSPGDSLAGFRVVRVDRGGSFVVVAARDLTAAQAAITRLPGVRYVEDNVAVHSLVTPNDTRYAEQYGPGQMGFPAAWDRVGYGSSGVTVAVIDSGIHRTHEDFTPASRIKAGHDYHNGDTNPADDCGHGTHVSGTVAASTANAKGVAGMSQATILPFKVLSAPDILGRCSGSAANIASAIRAAADQGAKVISMSIGGPDATVERDAVLYAASKGVLIVAAAGNDGGANSIDYPGAYPDVIAVAALTSTKARASYSDGGPQLDISGPSSNVLSTYSTNNTSYSSLSGTSMATPHVAGALALALSCAPGTTVAQMKDALYQTAEDLGPAGRDDQYGHGLARADRLVERLCGGTPPENRAPSASFTSSTSGLTVSVNGSASSDPDGDPLTYAWTFGDGASATGATASRTYAAAGTYTVTLTVNDGRGGTHSTSQVVTVTAGGGGGDPDPSTPTLTSGQQVSVAMTAAGQEKFFKVSVPAGKSQLQVVMTGPACGLLGCTFDADLYTRLSARPTATTYACRPYASGSNETCTHASPAAGYWYVRVHAYTGTGTVTLKATVS